MAVGQVNRKSSGGEPQVNSNWNAVSGVEEILNKPTIVSPVKSDWNATSGYEQILNKPTMLYASAVFTKATVINGEHLLPFGISHGSTMAEYQNYYPLPRGKKFIIRQLYMKLKGTPTVAGKVTVTLKETGTTDNQQVLTSDIWNTNAAGNIKMFALGTPWEPIGVQVGLTWDGLYVKLNFIDGLTVNITDAIVIVFIEYKTT